MRKIAHIVNPVMVNESSDLFIAQPITFETMRVAKEFAANTVDVTLVTAQYPEDHPTIPKDFIATPDLNRSVLDIATFQKKRKLPLIKDILDRLHNATDAEYLIYTNVDIALMPHFYLTINKIIEVGHDAFVINRRTISDQYKRIEDIPLMYAEVGKHHPGHDCFVFQRDMYPKFKLGNICIGVNRIGLVLICNLIKYARNINEFKNEHITFHLGAERVWQGKEYADYNTHNESEALEILKEFKNEVVTFDSTTPLGTFLLDFKRNRDLNFAQELFTSQNGVYGKKYRFTDKVLNRLLSRK